VTNQLPKPALRRSDPLISWLCDQVWLWRRLPHPIQDWPQRWRSAFLRRTLTPMLLTAQDAGAGVHIAWVEPGTPDHEILAWIDRQLATIPRAEPLDWCKVVIAHCTEAEWQAFDTGQTVELPDDRLAVEWIGRRSDWWRGGREEVERAIPLQHAGLSLHVIRLGTAYVAVTQQGRR